MPINTLEEIYSKKGDDFIQSLFNLQVVIKENFDGTAFCFQRTGINIDFFKRSNVYLSPLERTIIKLYEEPISYITSLPDDIIFNLPATYKFCFEYFPNNKPNNIIYDNLPKHKLILTHIIETNLIIETGVYNTTTIIDDIETITKYAKMLDVTPNTIIYDGYLTDQQKEQIYSYLRLTTEEVKEKFKTTSFTKFIISILNPDLTKTVLNNDLEKTVDSIVFQFKNNDKTIYAKLIDPLFDEIILNNKKQEQKTDILPIIYSNIIEFISTDWKQIEKIRLKQKNADFRYIELISRLFNRFIALHGNKYDGVDKQLPMFTRKPEFDLNTLFIDNPETLQLVNSNKAYRELFKIFLALFKRKKKNHNEFLNQVTWKLQNELVDKIIDFIAESNGEDIDFPTFQQFLQNYDEPLITESNEIDEIELDEKKKEEVKEYKVNETNPLHIVTFWQKAFEEDKTEKQSKRKKEVNLVFGHFQPFHKGHLETCEKIFKENKKPIVLIQLMPKKINEKYPFDEKLNEDILNRIVESNQKIFKEFHIYKENNVKNIIKSLDEKYKPILIAGNDGLQKQVKKIIEYDVFENELDLNYEIKFNGFTHHELEANQMKSEQIRKLIDENDYNKFKEQVPESLFNLFEKMRESKKSFGK